MRTKVATGEAFTIALHCESLQLLASGFQAKVETAGIIEPLSRANQHAIATRKTNP